MIVDASKPVKCFLATGQILWDVELENIAFKRSMKAFLLALGLGVAGPAVTDLDIKPHQPGLNFA